MKIISWNVNGIRSVERKGAWARLLEEGANIIAFQEIKAFKEQLSNSLARPKNYFAYFHSARRPGYSGTVVYAKEKPRRVFLKMGWKRFDDEGRFLRLDFSRFIFINLYLPHGGRQKENLAYKLAAYQHLLTYLSSLKDRPLILAGDFNIAHQEIDLARPRENKNNIMFTLQERQQIERLINLGLVNSFRYLHPRKKAYSWWPYFAHARARNLGWRIDYLFLSPPLLPLLKRAFIKGDFLGSDHAPVGVVLEDKNDLTR